MNCTCSLSMICLPLLYHFRTKPHRPMLLADRNFPQQFTFLQATRLATNFITTINLSSNTAGLPCSLPWSFLCHYHKYSSAMFPHASTGKAQLLRKKGWGDSVSSHSFKYTPRPYTQSIWSSPVCILGEYLSICISTERRRQQLDNNLRK